MRAQLITAYRADLWDREASEWYRRGQYAAAAVAGEALNARRRLLDHGFPIGSPTCVELDATATQYYEVETAYQRAADVAYLIERSLMADLLAGGWR